MSAFHVLNELSQLFQDSIATLLKDAQQSTLWVGSTAETETAITELTIHESQTEVVLRAYIPNVQMATLDVQIGQETVLIQGQGTESAEVEGYFRPSRFQSLIPLPYCVHPETVQAFLEQDVLTIRFPKQGEIQPSRVRVELKHPNLVIPQLCTQGLKFTTEQPIYDG
jgi:HSP20 family molecular chaperone IbpA